MKSSPRLLLGLVILASAPNVARASCEKTPPLASCIDADSTLAHATLSRFIFVRGADLRREGGVGFGLATSYLLKPITLRAPSASPSGVEIDVVRDLVKTSLSSWIGVFDDLEAGVTWPVTLYRTGSGIAPYASSTEAPFARTFVGAPRLSLAYALFSRAYADRRLSVAGRVDGLVPFIGRAPFASESGPVVSLGASAEGRAASWWFGIDLGIRARERSRLATASMGSQGYLAMGVGYDIFDESLGLALETYALPVLTSQPSGKALIPAEWTLQARSAPFPDRSWSFLWGAGTALPFSASAITAPAFRSTLAIRYTPASVDAP